MRQVIFGVAALVVAGCGCEGSMDCGPERTPPPGCTVVMRGECPGQDWLSCCEGAVPMCRYDTCPSTPAACPPRTDVGPIDAPPMDATSVDAPIAPGTDAPVTSACTLRQPFDVGVTYTRTLHVTVGGTGDGSSMASALGDIEEALGDATPGTRIVVHPGVYTGGLYVSGITGTATAPIALHGEPGAILEGGGEALHVSASEYLVIEGFEARNTTANGINVDDGGDGSGGNHLVFRDLHIHHVGTGGNSDCLKLSGLDDFWVLGSEMHDCNAGDAIDMVGCHDAVIAGSHFHDSPGNGVQGKGGSADVLMHGNLFERIAQRSVNAGGSTGLEFFRPIDAPHEAARLMIVANVIVEPGDTPIAYVGCDACVFAFNTVVEPGMRIARILQETTDARFVPSRNGLFVNNLVVYEASVVSSSFRFVNIGGDTAPETFTFGSNLWYASDSPSTAPMIPAPIPAETGSISGMAPMLAADFTIPAASPAVGLGREVAALAGIPDRVGRCRGTPPAAGAYEPTP